MIENCKKIIENLNEEINDLALKFDSTSLIMIEHAITLIINRISEIKAIVLERNFATQEEEINELNNGNGQRPAGRCVRCAILLAILKALDIAVGIPEKCTAASKPDEVHTLLTRKEVMDKLNIKDSTYTRWVDRGILVPRIMGTRHFFTEADLGRAFEESKRKGKR